MSTHIEFMTQKTLSTLQSITFQSQCAHAHLNRENEIYMIHETHEGDFLLQEKYLYTFLNAFVSSYELQLFSILE